MRAAWVLTLLLASVPAHAQVTSPQATGSEPDFLFGRPERSLTLRGSWLIARAGSDLFTFVEHELTVDKGDFNAAAFAADYGVAFTSRMDVVIGVDISRASVTSEYRNFVDSNRQPIEQTTSLKELNLSGSIRYALAPRGRAISRLAWVPRPIVPYAGAGIGIMWYQFRQAGDFIDVLDPQLTVFTDRFEGQGWTRSAQVFGGVDVKIHRRVSVTLDGRYVWAAGQLGTDFENFDPIDLAGFRIGAGINVLF